MSFNGNQGDKSSGVLEDLIQDFSLKLEEPSSQLSNFPVVGDVSNNKKKINFLLLGKTGHGKSATGNSTLGHEAFESKASMTSVTSEVKCGQVELGNYVVKVIDSPGLADTNFNENKHQEIEKAIENMERAIRMCPEGIHAFLCVVKFGSRFTDEEQTALNSLKQIFGHRFLEQHGIIVFTHGDAFEQAMEEEDVPDKSFDEWCEEQRGALSDLIKECRNRCVLVNNRQKNEQQKQAQMKNVIDLALTVHRPYTLDDFSGCQRSRDKLIVEIKAPKLKADFQLKINALSSEMESSCGSDNATDAECEHFEQKCEVLRMEIKAADKNTGLLDDLIEKISFIRSRIDEHKRRQAEARQRQIEQENARREAEARQQQIAEENARIQAQINSLQNQIHHHHHRRRRHKDCSIQ